MNTGLKQRIELANSEQEIFDLLKQGENYAQASDKTKRRWQRVATERTKFLEQCEHNEKGNK